MRTVYAISASMLCVVLSGCGSQGASTGADADASPDQASATGDAAVPSDATSVTPDAAMTTDAAVAPDGGVGTGFDATVGADAAGTPPSDAGGSTDTNTPQADAAPASDSSVSADSGSDAGPKPGDGGALPKITVWLAGDSTVANGETPCPVGWGKEFGADFDSSVTIVNSAVGGTSIDSWLYNVGTTMDSSGNCVLAEDGGQPTVQAHWQAMLNGMKTGDYLFIQFGINDGAGTCPQHDSVDQFKTSLGVMADAAKARGAQPIFVTPVSSIACKGSTAYATRGTYATATMQAATADSVPLLDLETLSVALYNSSVFCPLPDGETDVSDATPGPVGAFFCDDHTHFETTGAMQIAGLVATAVKNQNFGLAAYLK